MSDPAVPPAPGGGRIPGLDGLRAISITLVMLAHVIDWRYTAPFGSIGTLGVRVFFVISGYLITTLLIEEKRRHGRISLGGFYLRRAFRILPASYVFLGALLVLDQLRLVELRPNDLLAALTYTMNYHHDRAWCIGHLWSLSVEEQFYLLWPAVLRVSGLRGGLYFCGVSIVLVPLIRLGTLMFLPEHRPGIGETFQTTFDSIAVGCVLAGTRDWLAAQPRYLPALRSRWFLLVPLSVFVLCALGRFAKANALVGESLTNFGVALCIDRSVRYSSDLAGRILNSRPLVFLGGLSYSLYLWQQPFLRHDAAWPIQRRSLNIVMVFTIATISFYFVEKPFLRLRARIERRWRKPAA